MSRGLQATAMSTDKGASTEEPRHFKELLSSNRRFWLWSWAALSELDEKGTDQPVAYFSTKPTLREQKYATFEQECLTIQLAGQTFAVYLFGLTFQGSDGLQSITRVEPVKEKNARLIRWSLSLQGYSFAVEHKNGHANANMDTLSRIEGPCCTREGGESVAEA